MNPETLTLSAIFVVGLATSLHCAGMCGLLTCGLGIAGQGPAMAASGLYHAARLFSYAIAGSIAGGVGQWLQLRMDFHFSIWIPLLLFLSLLAVAFGLDRKLGAVPGIGRVVHRIRFRTMKYPPLLRASIIGLATPLLPCGPLYAMIALSLASGSAAKGAGMMVSFGLGPIPAIWAVQLGAIWVNRRLGTRGFLIAKRTLAVGAALSLLWHFSFFQPLLRAESADSSTCRCTPPTE